jgi:hypothetical protein
VDSGWNSPNVPAGAGLVARNDTGRVLYSAWKTLSLCASAEEAEILALLEGSRYFAANPQYSGILETDCVRIVAVLSSPDRGTVRQIGASLWRQELCLICYRKCKFARCLG